jgi:hypothetical protein
VHGNQGKPKGYFYDLDFSLINYMLLDQKLNWIEVRYVVSEGEKQGSKTSYLKSTGQKRGNVRPVTISVVENK